MASSKSGLTRRGSVRSALGLRSLDVVKTNRGPRTDNMTRLMSIKRWPKVLERRLRPAHPVGDGGAEPRCSDGTKGHGKRDGFNRDRCGWLAKRGPVKVGARIEGKALMRRQRTSSTALPQGVARPRATVRADAM